MLSAAINKAVSFIADREDFSASAYWDVNGYAIGYGNHYYQDGTAVQSGDIITEPDAKSLLYFFADQNARAIDAQLQVAQTTNQLAALTSIRYNCGTITTALLGLINSGAAISEVQEQIRQTCITAAGFPRPDLVNRRNLEAELYGTPSGISIYVIAAAAVGLYFLLD